MKLKDKVAVVTGAASGIGAASARLFAAEGARLALVDQDKVGLGQVAADIEAAGGSAIIIPADVSSDVEARAGVAGMTMTAAIGQILVLDLVFSLDSIITAVGMTNEIEIMVVAVLVAVGLMLAAADPLARFIGNNPTIVMLALGFLLMIGATLLADGVGVHVPKGYIYAAMAFSALIEGLNMMARRRKRKK